MLKIINSILILVAVFYGPKTGICDGFGQDGNDGHVWKMGFYQDWPNGKWTYHHFGGAVDPISEDLHMGQFFNGCRHSVDYMLPSLG